MKIKIKFVIIQVFISEKFVERIIGKISAISTSKIKKIIAIKKNRIEKGIREEFIGLNPHSKGEIFSCSKKFFLLSIEDKIITIKAINKMIIEVINKFKIIYIKLI